MSRVSYELQKPVRLQVSYSHGRYWRRQTNGIAPFRKHLHRHGKPFVCHEPDCSRGPKGFSTKNDLDRHKKSVHHIIPENTTDRSFKCAGINCSKRDKVWPRLDNFKSHCLRMHKTEDVDELIKQSAFAYAQGLFHDADES